MNKILAYIKNFMGSVESTDCESKSTEYIDGKAFEYKTYPISNGAMYCLPGDTITGTITDSKYGKFSVSEEIGKSMVIDTVGIFRCKEAFGMTDCIGAAFGKSK